MKYAVLSDVHGNLEALTAVLEDLEKGSVHRTIFLGDAIGYGADPKDCLNLIGKKSNLMILGNHDNAIATGTGLEDLNQDASFAAKWTAGILNDHDKDRLKKLPLEQIDTGIHFVHGSPHEPERYNYVITDRDANRGFASCKSQIIFVGHSHIPKVFVEVEYRRTFTGEVRRIKEEGATRLQIGSKYRYIINVGSVGQPRDGDSRAAYGIYDSEEGTYFLIRITYDAEKAAEKIRKTGLPGVIAERLVSGR